MTSGRLTLSRPPPQYNLNKHFSLIEAECIDKLDKLFGQQTKGDEVSRSFFVTQLRQLFDEADLDDELRAQATSFLDSIDSFLELLLAVRNLPEGDEYQDDRIISTLKLMSFIRTIGRSEIFVRYVQRLVGYHVVRSNHVEAALTLKLHADLHEWDLSTFVEPLPDLELPHQTEFARKEYVLLSLKPGSLLSSSSADGRVVQDAVPSDPRAPRQGPGVRDRHRARS